MTRFALVQAGLLVAVTATASVAHGAVGVVTGTFKFHNANGGFCPDPNSTDPDYAGRDCTGARYTHTMFNTSEPVRYVKVYVRSVLTGDILGQGSTNSSGKYTISWSMNDLVFLVNHKATIEFRLDHKDGRFKFRNPNGQWTQYKTSTEYSLENETTGASPQQIATHIWGSSLNNAKPDINAYWAAEFTWRKALSRVPALVNGFTGLEIRGFADTIWTSCPHSCQFHDNLGGLFIQLDLDAKYMTQTRIMHELGHAANDVLKPLHSTSKVGGYCKPDDTGSCFWGRTDDEWGNAGWMEAIASFAADSTLYAPSANPLVCDVIRNACKNPSRDTSVQSLETSHKLVDCQTGEQGWPLTQMRFFWDIYDDDDSIHLDDDGLYASIWDILQSYSSGCTSMGIDAPFRSYSDLNLCDYTVMAQPDERGASLYVNYMSSVKGLDLGAAWTGNCSLP